MPETVLTEEPGEDGIVKLILDWSRRWPVRIVSANGSEVDLCDQEARALLKVLQERYPLDGLANA